MEDIAPGYNKRLVEITPKNGSVLNSLVEFDFSVRLGERLYPSESYISLKMDYVYGTVSGGTGILAPAAFPDDTTAPATGVVGFANMSSAHRMWLNSTSSINNVQTCSLNLLPDAYYSYVASQSSQEENNGPYSGNPIVPHGDVAVTRSCTTRNGNQEKQEYSASISVNSAMVAPLTNSAGIRTTWINGLVPNPVFIGEKPLDACRMYLRLQVDPKWPTLLFATSKGDSTVTAVAQNNGINLSGTGLANGDYVLVSCRDIRLYAMMDETMHIPRSVATSYKYTQLAAYTRAVSSPSLDFSINLDQGVNKVLISFVPAKRGTDIRFSSPRTLGGLTLTRFRAKWANSQLNQPDYFNEVASGYVSTTAGALVAGDTVISGESRTLTAIGDWKRMFDDYCRHTGCVTHSASNAIGRFHEWLAAPIMCFPLEHKPADASGNNELALHFDFISGVGEFVVPHPQHPFEVLVVTMRDRDLIINYDESGNASFTKINDEL